MKISRTHKWRGVVIVFAHNASVARPVLDQSSIDAEVFTREPALHLGNLEHLVE